MWFSAPLRKSPFMPSMPTAARCCGKTSSANKPGASMEATDIVLAPQWQATSWLRVRWCSGSAGAYSESTRYLIPKLRRGLKEVQMDSSVSFEKDIVPIFRQFRDSMMWRLDLTSFEDVKANASMIYSQIEWSPGTQPGMPPPPYPPLTAPQVAFFKAWKDGGFPP